MVIFFLLVLLLLLFTWNCFFVFVFFCFFSLCSVVCRFAWFWWFAWFWSVVCFALSIVHCPLSIVHAKTSRFLVFFCSFLLGSFLPFLRLLLLLLLLLLGKGEARRASGKARGKARHKARPGQAKESDEFVLFYPPFPSKYLFLCRRGEHGVLCFLLFSSLFFSLLLQRWFWCDYDFRVFWGFYPSSRFPCPPPLSLSP